MSAPEPVCWADGDRVIWRGVYKCPHEAELLLAEFRCSIAEKDWFHRSAKRLADQLEAAMQAAGYFEMEGAI